ncbi:MAG: CAP domain-containing protein [Cytophagales bacterium]|nr:MAG: CAP domain-containing protein [Cytophagales bacterium]
MLDLINQTRTAGCVCGTTNMPPVAALKWNTKLEDAAYKHSLDMKTKNYFDHNNKEGQNPGARITQTGYSWSTYGENIALGYTTEKAVMDGWIKSEGHCKNIMNGSFTEVGVGRSGNYWTQVFAKPK